MRRRARPPRPPSDTEQQACSCIDRAADGTGERNRAFGGISDAVKAGHHRVGVGDKFVHARGPDASELDRRMVDALPRRHEYSATSSVDMVAKGRSGGCIDRRHDDEDERDAPVARDDIERVSLLQASGRSAAR